MDLIVTAFHSTLLLMVATASHVHTPEAEVDLTSVDSCINKSSLTILFDHVEVCRLGVCDGFTVFSRKPSTKMQVLTI